MGFQKHWDGFCIVENKNKLANKLLEFSIETMTDEEISKKYGVKPTTDFNIKKAQTELAKNDINTEIIRCTYRPFEERYIFLDNVIVDRPKKELLLHSKNKENIILGIGRQGLAIGEIDL